MQVSIDSQAASVATSSGKNWLRPCSKSLSSRVSHFSLPFVYKQVKRISQLIKTLIIHGEGLGLHGGRSGVQTHKIVHVGASKRVNAVYIGKLEFVYIRAILLCIGSSKIAYTSVSMRLMSSNQVQVLSAQSA